MIRNRWLASAIGLISLLLASGCFVRPTTATVHGPRPPHVVYNNPAPAPVVHRAPSASVTVNVPNPASILTGVPISTGGAVANGVISYPGQRVRYPLSINYGRTVSIYVDGHGLDPTVAIYDSFGNRLGFNDDGGTGLDSQLVRTLPPGAYLVEVSGYSSSTGPFTITVN